MRDGTKLFTSVYVQKDDSKKYKILMLRNPYSIEPYGINNYPTRLGPSDLFTKEGFIFVYQDVLRALSLRRHIRRCCRA